MVLLLLQMTIEKAAQLVCSQFPLVENICKETINKYVNDIVQSILNAPPRQDICVTLRLCKCQVGECRGDCSDPFLEGPDLVPNYVQQCLKTQKYICHRELHKQLIYVPPSFHVVTCYFPPLCGKSGDYG